MACKNCVYWSHRWYTDPIQGKCQKNPPTVTHDGETAWPWTKADNTCGEFSTFYSNEKIIPAQPGFSVATLTGDKFEYYPILAWAIDYLDMDEEREFFGKPITTKASGDHINPLIRFPDGSFVVPTNESLRFYTEGSALVFAITAREQEKKEYEAAQKNAA
jgi:hypothetical protein